MPACLLPIASTCVFINKCYKNHAQKDTISSQSYNQSLRITYSWGYLKHPWNNDQIDMWIFLSGLPPSYLLVSFLSSSCCCCCKVQHRLFIWALCQRVHGMGWSPAIGGCANKTQVTFPPQVSYIFTTSFQHLQRPFEQQASNDGVVLNQKGWTWRFPNSLLLYHRGVSPLSKVTVVQLPKLHCIEGDLPPAWCRLFHLSG